MLKKKKRLCFSFESFCSALHFILNYVNFVSEVRYSLHQAVIKSQGKTGIGLDVIFQAEIEKLLGELYRVL